ncbi:MFS transporter [Cupriavidus necator]|uniref:MFS transporter n=2 Tax=Cupriavidus necator TaxID=106590 RepID=A0A367PB47_CUPNE|nr:MFS transporter [Cupriavidus necator]RCJ05082.1 MFS transporter [Cupriavidus necator]
MRRFGTLAIAAVMSMASMRACDALLPALSSDFAVPIGMAAWSISAFALAYGLMQLVYGPLGDRFGKLRVVTLALTGCAVANVMAAVAPTMPALALARGLSGAAAAGVIPMSMAMIGDTVPVRDRQQVLARFFLATIGGMIGGQWMSGLIADWLHWRVVFWVLAAGSGIAALVVWMQGPGMVSDLIARRSFGEQFRSVLGQPRARLVFAVTAIEGLFTLTGFAFVPTYLHGRFGLGLGTAGAVMAMYGVGGLAYVALSGVLIRRLGSDALAALGGALLGAAFAIVAVGPRWEWSVPGCFLGGLGFYMLHNTLQTQATEVFPPSRGTAVGLFAASLFLGQALGMSGAAAVAGTHGERWLFAAAAVALPLLGMAFGGRLRTDGPRHRPG